LAALEEKRGERVITRSVIQREAEDSDCEAGTLFARSFFGADFLVEKVAYLFNEDGGEEFLRAVGGEVNLAHVAAVATPKSGHVGGGKCADSRKDGKVGPTEGGEVFEGGRPVQARAKDALQIGFCRWAGGPLGEGLQETFQCGRDNTLGEFGCGHDALDSCIGKMFKKERRKWDFFGKMIGDKMSQTGASEQSLCQAHWFL
jgi:hypothetical protein